MLAEYKKNTNIGVGLWIVANLAGIIIYSLSESEEAAAIARAFSMGGMFPLVYGLYCYAKGKGYHGAWGLLGLFTIVGLIILVCFPDRHKTTKKPKNEQKQ